MMKKKKTLSSLGIIVITSNLMLNSLITISANEIGEEEVIQQSEIIENEITSVQVQDEATTVPEILEEQPIESIEAQETIVEPTTVLEELPETVEGTQGFINDPEMVEEIVVQNEEFSYLEQYNREETYDLAMQMMYMDLEAKDIEPKLVASTSYSSTSKTGIPHVDNFINTIVPYAIEDSVNSGILPSITIAQGALESAWGLSGLTVNANNLFGIKASNDWTGEVYNVTTGEYAAPKKDAAGNITEPGYWYEVVAPFRKYSNWLGSIRDHGAFFSSTDWRKNNYRFVVGEKDYSKAAQALQDAGYATDPGYARKLITIIENYELYKYDQVPTLQASYHLQKHGWITKTGSYLSLGHAGDDLRIEDFQFNFPNNSNIGINFSAHIQKMGWVNDITTGNSVGNVGNALRTEAVKFYLTGEGAKSFDIYYRVYSDTIGWSGWAKNGDPAGTEGFGKKIRSVEIIISWKDQVPVTVSSNAFRTFVAPSVNYNSHVQKKGWVNWVSNGTSTGTVGQALRLEAMQISMSSLPYHGSIVYQTHVQKYGWLPHVSDGAMSGTAGESKRLEAIKIHLTSTMAKEFDVYYRTHIQTYGWTGWAKNGEPSGSEGLGRRMEAVQVRLVKKGQKAPGSTAKAFYK